MLAEAVVDGRGDDLLKVAEVAEEFGVTVPAVHGWINRGKLRAVKLRGGRALRVPRSALEEYKKRRESLEQTEKSRSGVWEAARYLRLHPNRVYEMVRDGELPHERGSNGRILFDMEELRRHVTGGS